MQAVIGLPKMFQVNLKQEQANLQVIKNLIQPVCIKYKDT